MKSRLGFDFVTFSVPVTLMSTWAGWISAVAIIYCLNTTAASSGKSIMLANVVVSGVAG
jgi:hypothetical protein